ncbi:DHH family phosphoesterase [Candidatus Arthromitus sp. SFB-rat-Yit]|uniref:DHH family phosphoesterase n=1 Tax=Candidatus Arthromitus sp. SFB-rat-Yit TaxID=1041504 RepID=UPI000227A7E4|nr:bifunctional oligoribonuclease/PAP phosphatase NrnA [Candidatus Arthromitus sp. SFB-rat-Yit]BAK81177.1 DHH subfamily 1 protein [Candidatus Arthromitus sp. SFB-rat-Yit]
MIKFDDIKSLIKDSENIGLSYHVSPDGDAVGSLLSLYFALKKLNKNVTIFSKDNLTNTINLRFLPSINEIDGMNYFVTSDIDLLIILDCGNVERVSCEVDFDKTTTLGIDHHISNDMYCTYNFVQGDASSTGEIVFDIIKNLGIEIDQNIAKCIYTSIMTDTGGLRFESTSQKTFNIVGELVATKFDFWNTYEQLFLYKTFSKVKLLGLVYNELKLVDNQICVIHVTNDMLNKSNSTDEQTNDIVSYGLTIDGVRVSILIKDFNGKHKVSLRSKGCINVCEIAKKFGGGGHIKASAFVTDLKRDVIERMLVEEFRNLLK